MANVTTRLRAVRREPVFTFFWQEGVATWPFFRLLFTLLLSVDVALILLHVLYLNFETFQKRSYDIEFEYGYGELYQAIKGGWIVLIFFWLAWNRQLRAYLVWAGLFLYITLDDFLQIHEQVGAWLAERFQIPAMLGLRSVDFGELTVYAVVALCFVPLFILAYRFGSTAFRRDTRTIIAILVLLGLFGVGVDMVHSLVATTVFSHAVGMLEDGGELVVMTILLWYTFVVLARHTLGARPTN